MEFATPEHVVKSLLTYLYIYIRIFKKWPIHFCLNYGNIDNDITWLEIGNFSPHIQKTRLQRHCLSTNSVKMTLLINGGNSYNGQFVRDFRIKPAEALNLLQTARDTSELKHSTLFNGVQSVSHKEITVKNYK